MRPTRLLLFACFALVALGTASGQTRRLPPATDCGKDSTASQPFTLEFQLIDTKAGPDGELVTSYYSTQINAQDSDGREFMSVTAQSPSRTTRGKATGRVCDPTRQQQIIWDSDQKLAVVLAMPSLNQRHGCWVSDSGEFTIDFDAAKAARAASRSRTLWEASAAGRTGSPANFEDLGTVEFQGLQTHGYRSTWPPAAPGDSIPAYLAEEHWVAPSLGMWVKQQVDYPRRQGFTVKWAKELISYMPGEPAQALFEVPDGFEVVKQSMHPGACSRPDADKVPH